MAIANRPQFIDYCLRELGAPVVNIEVDDSQIEDRIDEAIEYFRQYHWDGIEKMYMKHQVTAEDVTNRSIPIVDDLIYGVTRVIPLQAGSNSNNIFDVQYQLRLHDLYDLTSTSIIYYDTVMSHISTLDLVLSGHERIRFNRFKGKVDLDVDWGFEIKEGDWLVFECHRVLDPATNVKMYNDLWLKRYATALLKRQWAANGKKFTGLQLAGGVTIDWQGMYDEAVGEIKDLEQDLIDSSAPLDFYMG
jgi:hypothetical protein